MFFTILLWIFIMGIIVTDVYVIRNLLKKVEIYEELTRRNEEFYLELQTELVKVLNNIKAVDLRGAFEADDEVGDTFITIKNLILKLEGFLREE